MFSTYKSNLYPIAWSRVQVLMWKYQQKVPHKPWRMGFFSSHVQNEQNVHTILAQLAKPWLHKEIYMLWTQNQSKRILTKLSSCFHREFITWRQRIICHNILVWEYNVIFSRKILLSDHYAPQPYQLISENSPDWWILEIRKIHHLLETTNS